MSGYYYATKILTQRNLNTLPITENDIVLIIKSLGWKIKRIDLSDQTDLTLLDKLGIREKMSEFNALSYFIADKLKIVLLRCELSARAKRICTGPRTGAYCYESYIGFKYFRISLRLCVKQCSGGRSKRVCQECLQHIRSCSKN